MTRYVGPRKNESVISRVKEQQISFNLDVGHETAPTVLPDLRDEIAAIWGLPLGHRVEVCLRGTARSAVTGLLVLRRAPDHPWDPREALHLAVAGFPFTSREIERWTKL